jgi:biopolymer transport protein ExbD
MRLPRRSRKKARIEIIPMIDTMFFLLVFFMVATLSMAFQRGLPVNLPYAATARDEIRDVVTITLTKDGKLFCDREPVFSTAEVAARLLDRKKAETVPSVVVNADRDVEHGKVIDLMDAVRQTGVTKIAIAVKPVF